MFYFCGVLNLQVRNTAERANTLTNAAFNTSYNLAWNPEGLIMSPGTVRKIQTTTCDLATRCCQILHILPLIQQLSVKQLLCLFMQPVEVTYILYKDVSYETEWAE